MKNYILDLKDLDIDFNSKSDIDFDIEFANLNPREDPIDTDVFFAKYEFENGDDVHLWISCSQNDGDQNIKLPYKYDNYDVNKKINMLVMKFTDYIRARRNREALKLKLFTRL